MLGAMDVGGAELRTLDLMRDLRETDITFHFLTLSGRKGTLAAEVECDGGVIHPIALNAGFPFAYLRLLHTLRPEVIDSHVATFSGVLLAGARLARVPRRIAHFHSDGDGHPDTARRRVQRSVTRALIRMTATDIVGVSPSALSRGYRQDWQTDPRAAVMVNGVPEFHVLDSDSLPLCADGSQLALLHVGRPSPEKNRPLAVRVLSDVLSAGIDAHLYLAGGSGVDEAQLRCAIQSMGLEARVHDVGERRDIRMLMREADVLLLTSNREGLPGVVLESLSVGTPVVSTDLPGARYIAEFIPTGVRIVADQSSRESWAAAVSESSALARDSDSRQQIARMFADSPFVQRRVTAAHVALYTRKAAGRDQR